MRYLYHVIPENLQGQYLMPLNQLKKNHPEIYQEHLKKYEGRESLLKFKIPKLNCLWNDVIHLTAVQPKKLDEAFREAEADLKWRKWFKVNPELLEPNRTIVYLYKKRPLIADPTEFVPFKVNDLSKYSHIGEKTRDYFKEEVSKGRRPLMFHLVPHVLYKGKLKIKDLEVIEI